MDLFWAVMVVVGMVMMGLGVGNIIGSWAGKRYYARKVRNVEAQIGRQVLETILPQAGFGVGDNMPAFSERYVEANGTVHTDDLDLVRGWLEDVANRLREVGIRFVSQSYVAKDGHQVYWSIGVSDPVSTREELALMVGNAIQAAGDIPT